MTKVIEANFKRDELAEESLELIGYETPTGLWRFLGVILGFTVLAIGSVFALAYFS